MVHSGQLKSWFIAYLDEFEKWPILDPIGQINLPEDDEGTLAKYDPVA